MIRLEHTKVVCDKCRAETEDSKLSRWFVFKNGGNTLDLCLKCAHVIHYELVFLGIKHVWKCYEYADEPEVGLIEIL